MGRFAVAVLLVLFAVLGATTVPVRQGSATVVTRFGDPRRVLVEPGLAFKLPAPFERASEVDLRLRTTSSGLHDVGTKEGLRILVQAYLAWQVPSDPERIRLYVRAVRNDPKLAADQLRSALGSALETATSTYRLEELLTADPARLRISEYEERLKQRLITQIEPIYGITVHQVGIERFTLPTTTMDTIVERMRSDRTAVAEEVQAVGRTKANEIRAAADRDSRLTKAKAQEDAAAIEAAARVEAARIFSEAYRADPALYEFFRSLDVLDQIVHDGTRLIFKTDAAPFRALIEGPEALEAMKEGAKETEGATEGDPPDDGQDGARRDDSSSKDGGS
jgi:membrane protease subunit HflC